MAKTEKKVTRRHASEKAVAQSLLGDFDVQNSRGLSLIESLLGNDSFESISRNALLSLTIVLSKFIEVQFPRNFSRRKALIVKWYDDNADEIIKAKQFISVEYAYSNSFKP